MNLKVNIRAPKSLRIEMLTKLFHNFSIVHKLCTLKNNMSVRMKFW